MGTVLREAAGVEEREREEGGGDLGEGRVFPACWGRGGSSQPVGHHNHFSVQSFPVRHLTLW